jgi:hypothetical protein
VISFNFQNNVNNTYATDFIITGQPGSHGIANITVPKSAVPEGFMPVVYINGTLAQYQSYSQDAINYYVSFYVHFSTHLVSMVFQHSGTSSTSSTTSSSSSTYNSHSPLPTGYATPVIAVFAVVVGCFGAAVLFLGKRKRTFWSVRGIVFFFQSRASKKYCKSREKVSLYSITHVQDL